MQTIIVIEDDSDIRDGIRILLKNEGYEIQEAGSGEEGLKKLTPDTDLIILDIMMPGMGGIRTCEEIRKVSNVPILFLTAKTKESDKLLGLMAGGDDYLGKPFSYAELLGRVKALLRRYTVYAGKTDSAAPADPEDDMLHADDITVNRQFNEVLVSGKPVELSQIDYRILLLLMEHPKRVFSAQMIYEQVWNEVYYYSSNSTVMVHIRTLRVKIEEDPQHPRHICTSWGKGYYFV